MSKKYEDVLKEVLIKVNPEEKVIKEIDSKLKEFLIKINKNIDSLKINADVFLGGSFAKGTVVKKGVYDVDLFLRFSKEYPEKDFTKMAKRILDKEKNLELVHGSRDYFRLKVLPNVYFEIIPVRKISKPSEAENITDLSYSHVKYLNKKIKSKKILEDIKLAKIFCHATNTYGAESYIHGFSGYSLELLVYHYKSFFNFLKAMIKIKDKEIIDIEKLYKKKSVVLLDMNESKLQSSIILVDPTFKQRNALAGLSDETFEMFQKKARAFLKSPSVKAFEVEQIDLDKIRKEAGKKGQEFVALEIATIKDKGDIAGTKLLKFFNHLIFETGKYFEIKNKGFNYGDENSAECFLVVKPKKEIVLDGPFVKDKKNVLKFKAEHVNVFEKKGRVYVKEKIDFSLKEFVLKWKKKNMKKIEEMKISGIGVV